MKIGREQGGGREKGQKEGRGTGGNTEEGKTMTF